MNINILVVLVEGEDFRKRLGRRCVLLVDLGLLEKSSSALLVTLGNQQAIDRAVKFSINLVGHS